MATEDDYRSRAFDLAHELAFLMKYLDPEARLTVLDTVSGNWCGLCGREYPCPCQKNE